MKLPAILSSAPRPRRLRIAAAAAVVCASLFALTRVLHADAPKTAAEYQANPQEMLEAYRHVEVASVSDAVEQLLHEKRYMSHTMQPIFPTKFAGTALTVKLVKQENQDSSALSGMLKAIDTGGPGSVYVMQEEDGADVAGVGGLMGTAMLARNFSGAVVDGGVRDLAQLKKIGFPVYSTGSVPSTSVGHYRFAAMNVPVECGGVTVSPNDIIVADMDGVVVVPRARAAEVLILAQKLDFTEHSTYPYIEKFHSIEDAVKQFGRI